MTSSVLVANIRVGDGEAVPCSTTIRLAAAGTGLVLPNGQTLQPGSVTDANGVVQKDWDAASSVLGYFKPGGTGLLVCLSRPLGAGINHPSAVSVQLSEGSGWWSADITTPVVRPDRAAVAVRNLFRPTLHCAGYPVGDIIHAASHGLEFELRCFGGTQRFPLAHQDYCVRADAQLESTRNGWRVTPSGLSCMACMEIVPARPRIIWFAGKQIDVAMLPTRFYITWP